MDNEINGIAAPAKATTSSSGETRTLTSSAAGSSSGDVPALLGSKSAPRLHVGAKLGNRYEILQLLGEGGMGTVYKVRDAEVDRILALKVIRPDLAGIPGMLERFKQELVLARQVTHRNVVRIYDLGEADGRKFITMEYVEGEDLRSLLRRKGKLPVAEAVQVTEQIVAGLQAAHAEGVIHRDLKPGNIMLDSQGRAVVMDFGLARTLEGAGMTQTGVMMGTVEYMSPEQAEAKMTDVRSDLYTVGMILYELLSGCVPFKAKSALASLLKRTQERAIPVSEVERHVPLALSAIVSKCLEREPSKRYQSAQELLDALATFQGCSATGSLRDRWAAKLSPWLIASAALAGFGMLATVWFFTQKRPTNSASQHAPVSVLIADFANTTSESVFDGTLEPAFGLALEGASFISTYNRGQAHHIVAQLKPGTTAIDEAAARLIAVREGINVIVIGSISPDGPQYRLALKVEDGISGKVISSQEVRVKSKEVVLQSLANLANEARNSLGDNTPQSVLAAQAETFTSGSLEAAHEYALAQDLQWAGSWNEAVEHYKKAAELDPQMGRAYAGLAAVSANMGRRQDAEKYYQQSMALVGRMTQREKYRTRGGYYLMMREPQKAIEEYTALVKQFPADAAGRGNLALSYFYMRDMQQALHEQEQVVQASPKNLLQRNNLALYAVYAGQFSIGMREAQTVLQQNPAFLDAYNALAMAQIESGNTAQAEQTFLKLQSTNTRGTSMAAIGLADLWLFRGQPNEAIALLERAAVTDLAGKDNDNAAAKYIVLAQAELLAGHAAQAQSAAAKAITLDTEERVLYPAGQIFLETGQTEKATRIVSQLSSRIQPEPQMYGKLLDGEISLKRKSAQQSIQQFQAAQKIYDTWLGHYDLGRAYLQAGMFTEADSEFEVCLGRKGEASALFLDDVPTFRMVPTAYYYLGRAQEGLKSPAAAESYRTFVSLEEKGVGPLLADARRRLASK